MTPPADHSPQPYRSWERDRWMFDNDGQGGVVILMYHKIGAPLAGSRLHELYVGTRDFDRQMAELAAASQRPVPFGEAVETVAAGGSGFCLTFDDAFANVFDHALPILQTRGLRAMLFVVAGLVGAHDEWDHPVGEPPQPLMDERQIREWLAAGHEIGAHTVTHPALAEISPERARAEISDGKKMLEDRFGIAVRHFCYPYGSYDARVRDLVAEAGYATACAAATSPAVFGANRPGVSPLELRRVMACNRRSLARKVARLVRGK